MSCNPNVMEIVSPSLVENKGFSVTKAVRVTAYGLSGKDIITFKRVQYCSNQSGYVRDGCCLFTPEIAHITTAVEYQIGECAPSLTPKRNTIVIPYAGSYIPVVNGSDSADLVVEVEPINGTDFDDKEKGISPCGFCIDEVWETTGGERCNQHFIEQEEISNCGNIRWTKTEKRCGYFASVPIPITLDEGACNGSSFMGYLFHPSETRDPDATVEITYCAADGSEVLLGYAYPKAGDGHTLPIEECNGKVVGYAVNNSATAPQSLGDGRCQ